MMYPLPSVNKAYAMIISGESQRMTSGGIMSGNLVEPTTLYANKCNVKNFEGRENYGKGSYDAGKKKVNWNMYCDHCKLHGHIRNICYRLVGYLEG